MAECITAQGQQQQAQAAEVATALLRTASRNLLLAELQARLTTALVASEAHVCQSPRPQRDAYGSECYWEERYQRQDGLFEWLVTWEDLRDALLSRVAPAARVLHVGCGNSALGVRLAAAGRGGGGVVNVDVSATVVAQMRARFAHARGVTWDACDATATPYGDGAFDVVLDKRTLLRRLRACDAMAASGDDGAFDVVLDKGTLDAMLCKDPPQAKACAAAALTAEAHRVLRPGGTYIIVSFGQPETRLSHIRGSAPWTSVTFQKIPLAGHPHIWLYCATKQPPPPQQQQQ
ncbi:S-adenosyl-L-methionine-dependent methyltransferase [Tribonema minus]|uniref:S-adenosyl-L-methionine-dependent methyltransferase n=1 Tax=Tribonema minus TaxID=303371 RepID=A0A835YR81_9STRA|nr:S-adenosyl-L-methionine-dependent methyltransferase [Tribonema minus]